MTLNIPTDDYWTGKHCLKEELPWLVPSAVHKLDELLNKDDYVLEIGTGGSTLFYAKRCGFIQAVETNLEWGYVVRNKIIEQQQYLHSRYVCLNDAANIEYYLDVDCKLGPLKITVMSVDTEQGINRSSLFEFILCKYLHTLRIIVMDNYAEHSLWPEHWSMTEERMIERLGGEWRCFTFDDIHWYGKGTRIFLRNM